MKISARVTLGVVASLVALLIMSGLIAPLASAGITGIQPVPTPTIPNLISSPKPSSSPSEDPDPAPNPLPGEEEPTGGEEGEGGGGGGEEGSGGGGDGDGGKNDGGDAGGKNDGQRPGETAEEARRRRKRNKNKNDVVTPPASIAGRIPGAFDTSKLVSVAIRLRSLGMSQEEVVNKVYPPFIIAGNASWIDTWHAPRYGPAPGQIRVHEGQDVFCDYGDPILAPENGTLSVDDGGLGGITARVHRSDGKYWYMTHLSALNRAFQSGDSVRVGDVVGYCGNSGNAATTPPHVHFGFYGPGGVNPTNPMKHLVRWLHEAERRVLGVVVKTDKKRQREYESGAITAARRFGDSFVPGRSELTFAGESLWAAGSSPASGAFGLAEAALQEALSTNGLELGILPVPLDLQLPQAQGQTVLEPDSMLAQILAEATHTHTEGSD